MPDVRLKLDTTTHKKWRHVVIDVGGNAESVFEKMLDDYIKNKGNRII